MGHSVRQLARTLQKCNVGKDKKKKKVGKCSQLKEKETWQREDKMLKETEGKDSRGKGRGGEEGKKYP